MSSGGERGHEHALWVVVSGEVEVSARGEQGTPHLLRTMGPRSYFGEIGLLEHIPRTATVTAIEPCVLYRLPGDEFLAALTASTATASLLEGARTRLARSHPSYRPSFIVLPDVDQAAAPVTPSTAP